MKIITKEPYFIFPFSDVEHNSNIILYGYGNVGHIYEEQIARTNYCKIRAIVDANYKDYADNIISPNDMFPLNNDDKIVVSSIKYADDIKRCLISKGVPEKMIVNKYIPSNAEYISSIEANELTHEYLSEFYELITILKPRLNISFDRIGRDNDGGYIMLNEFSKGKIAYSFGISGDVSWDADMVSRGYDIFMYDHTIDELPQNNNHFHWCKLGVADSINHSSDLDTLENIIKKNGHDNEKHMILKMDVEGAEWGALQLTNSETLNKFDQMVFEFHDCVKTKNRELYLDILKKISKTHQCVHVHINNYSKIYMVNGINFGDCIEVTFVNKNMCEFEKYDSTYSLPIDLDQPCSPVFPEVILGRQYIDT